MKTSAFVRIANQNWCGVNTIVLNVSTIILVNNVLKHCLQGLVGQLNQSIFMCLVGGSFPMEDRVSCSQCVDDNVDEMPTLMVDEFMGEL